MSKYNIALLIALLLNAMSTMAQTSMGTDELYTAARVSAFEEDDYPKAISLIKQAIAKSPDYLEINIFLGRLYTFTDSLPEARMIFDKVLQKEKGHEEASLAYGNLEYWNSDSKKALEIVNTGLEVHKGSESLGILKAKILKDLQRYEEARTVLDNLLKANPKLTEARGLIGSINSSSAKNAMGIGYEYVYFDKRFDDPWHLSNIDYTRQTKLGSFATRINYANRFRTDGMQLEVDAYPRISDLFYSYLSAGISDNGGIFSKYRAGFSLYANLPYAFEADAGFRFLAFNQNTWIYTLGIGKYYSSFWFNFRTYLTPSNSSVSQSYSLTTRYYLGGADDFISFKIGTGLSPDDNVNSVSFDPNNIYKLKSYGVDVGYRKLFLDTNVLIISAFMENQEYNVNTKGNQFSVSLGYIKRF
ncbi:YaiO family outer membrane beta-barrel protein [Maribacter sp. X9]|uniref:YaiO family outer membrane beta-barrel protein n=1 Tax=Maribacter sp. X9 TaxID=3402159 RepID=UPI003AF3625E